MWKSICLCPEKLHRHLWSCAESPSVLSQGHVHTFSRTEGGHSRQLEAHGGRAEEGGFSRYSSWLSSCDLYNEALFGKKLLIIGLSIWSLSWEDPLEKGVASHFNILFWKIPWTEEPGRLQSIGSQRVGHDWATFTFTTNYKRDSFLLLVINCFLQWICIEFEPRKIRTKI